MKVLGKNFKYCVSGIVGGMNSEIVRFSEVFEDVNELEDYGDGLIYEENEKFGVLMESNVEGEFNLYFNDDKLNIEEVYDNFFEEGYKVM